MLGGMPTHAPEPSDQSAQAALESPSEASASLHETRQRLRRQRRRRVKTLARLGVAPAIVLPLVVWAVVASNEPLGMRLLGLVFLLLLLGGIVSALPAFRARVARVRRLSAEARALEDRSSSLEGRLLQSAGGRQAAGGVSLAESEGAGGALSLSGAGGALSLEAAPEGAAVATGLPPLRGTDRWRIAARAARDRLMLLMGAFVVSAVLVALLGLAEPDYIGVAVVVCGLTVFLPVLGYTLPSLFGVAGMAFGAQQVAVKPLSHASGGLQVHFALPQAALSEQTQSVVLPSTASVGPSTVLRGVVAASDDRLLYAVEVPGEGWVVRQCLRTD
jgi:hypothetical protein